jgi:hypothetical protein
VAYPNRLRAIRLIWKPRPPLRRRFGTNAKRSPGAATNQSGCTTRRRRSVIAVPAGPRRRGGDGAQPGHERWPHGPDRDSGRNDGSHNCTLHAFRLLLRLVEVARVTPSGADTANDRTVTLSEAEMRSAPNQSRERTRTVAARRRASHVARLSAITAATARSIRRRVCSGDPSHRRLLGPLSRF